MIYCWPFISEISLLLEFYKFIKMREHNSNCKLHWKRFSVGDWRGGMTVASGNQNCRKSGSFDMLNFLE